MTPTLISQLQAGDNDFFMGRLLSLMGIRMQQRAAKGAALRMSGGTS